MRLSCLKVVFVVAAAAIACSDGLAPTLIPGSFELHSVNGDRLPAQVGIGAGGPPSILSGSISLRADGTGEGYEVLQPSLGTPVTSWMQVRYELDGFRITIIRTDCPPNALCISFEGLLINGMLQVDRSGGAGDVNYVYQRSKDHEAIIEAWD